MISRRFRGSRLHFGTAHRRAITWALVGLVACTAPGSAEPFSTASSTLPTLGLARVGASLATLRDGRWLVIGGADERAASVASIALFDPTGDRVQTPLTLSEGRVYHTSTTLDDGRVVVLGGTSPSVPALTAVEIIDASAGTVTVGTAATEGRSAHTATLLGDGRIFVAGGHDAYGRVLATTALYDPRTNLWAAGPALAYPRFEHTATLLSDGGVLIAGSAPARGVIPAYVQLERFDPATNTMSIVGALRRRRHLHTATLLDDGRVLFAGGNAGDNTDLAFDDCEIFSPATRRSEPVPPMGIPRTGHTAVRSGNTVTVIGGHNDGIDAELTSQSFDVAAGVWSAPVRLAAGRDLAVAAVTHAGVLACGGTGYPRLAFSAGCERVPAGSTPLATLARGSSVRIEARESIESTEASAATPMVYDAARGSIVMLSTPQTEGGPQATYTWDGGSLHLIGDATTSPAPSRSGFGIAYDAARNRTVLFGGARRSKFNMDETWEWDGAHWSRITPVGVAPAPRVNVQLTYDTRRRAVLAFGGSNNTGLLNDLWSWDGTAWTQLAPVHNPPPSFGVGSYFAFDESRGVAVLVSRSITTNGTWEWDGTDWAYRAPPPSDDTVTIAYDASRRAVIAFASFNACSNPGSESRSTLLSWSGSGWTAVDGGFKAAASGCTGLVFGAYDRARSRMVLRGRWEVFSRWNMAELSTSAAPLRPLAVTTVTQDPLGFVYAAAPLTLRVDGRDDDGHALSLFADNALPDGANLETAAKLLHWTPREDQAGRYELRLGVTDGIRFSLRTVSVDVKSSVSTLFAMGPIRLRADVAWTGRTQDCSGTRGGCWTSPGETGSGRCDVTGTNPGRVSIECSGRFSWAYLYDLTRGTWNSQWDDVTASGTIASDGAWSAAGGRFAMSGRVQRDRFGDLELCASGVRYTPNDQISASSTAPCTPLYPVP